MGKLELTLHLLIKCLCNNVFHISPSTTYPGLDEEVKSLRQEPTQFLFPATPLRGISGHSTASWEIIPPQRSLQLSERHPDQTTEPSQPAVCSSHTLSSSWTLTLLAHHLSSLHNNRLVQHLQYGVFCPDPTLPLAFHFSLNNEQDPEIFILLHLKQ